MSISIKDAIVRVAFKTDGKDHVLVTPFCATQIGKYASMSWRKRFFIPQLGEFISPMAFMSWLCHGDESQRHANNPMRVPYMSKEEFLKYQRAGYLAKWYQLASMHGALVKQSKIGDLNLLDLPWVEYKVHTTGLKEFPQSQINAEILKGLVKLNVEHGNHDGLKLLAGIDFIPDFKLSDVQKWIDETVRERFNLEPVKEKPAKAPKTQAPAEEVQQGNVSGEEGLVEETTQA